MKRLVKLLLAPAIVLAALAAASPSEAKAQWVISFGAAPYGYYRPYPYGYYNYGYRVPYYGTYYRSYYAGPGFGYSYGYPYRPYGYHYHCR